MERTAAREDEIRTRLQAMGFTNQQINDIALYDWSNWAEHYDWIMSATKEAINDWMQSVERGIAS